MREARFTVFPTAVTSEPAPSTGAITTDPELTPTRIFGRTPKRVFDTVGCSGECGLDRQCCAAGPERSILLCLGHAENCHDAVTGETAHRAAMFTNRTGERFIDHAREMESIFLAKTFHDGGVSNHVREQYGDLAPLTQARRFARGNAFCFTHFRKSNQFHRLD